MITKIFSARLRASLSVILLGGALSLAPGCASHPPVPVNAAVIVPGDPPAIVQETVPPSPGVGFFWVGGSWDWNNQWVWDPGRWQRPPHQGAVWIPSRYVYRDGQHLFVRGGWQ